MVAIFCREMTSYTLGTRKQNMLLSSVDSINDNKNVLLSSGDSINDNYNMLLSSVDSINDNYNMLLSSVDSINKCNTIHSHTPIQLLLRNVSLTNLVSRNHNVWHHTNRPIEMLSKQAHFDVILFANHGSISLLIYVFTKTRYVVNCHCIDHSRHIISLINLNVKWLFSENKHFLDN